MNLTIANIERISAFSEGAQGGNPAGVYVGDTLPDEVTMQRLAAEIAYPETVFAAPANEGWRVRYFSPEAEVPFCGHATIALGTALARTHGSGTFNIVTNHANISVSAEAGDVISTATLQSPATTSGHLEPATLADVMALFELEADELDARIPPARMSAGANHIVLALNTRRRLAAMSYDMAAGRSLMKRADALTIALVHAERHDLFHVRNAFAAGGIYEDPATGAAAAALAGYLRDIGWMPSGMLDISQGVDMGCPSRIRVAFSEEKGSAILVSGTAVKL